MVKIKVLMVDDEERFRTTTAKILARKGFETILAASGEEALAKLDENPDVVILDVKMGGLDGHETLKLIKVKNPDLPVIMLTGHGDVPGAQKAYETGAFDYLAKPCDVDLLGVKIQDAHDYATKAPYVEKLAVDIMIPLERYTPDTPGQHRKTGHPGIGKGHAPSAGHGQAHGYRTPFRAGDEYRRQRGRSAQPA